MAHKVCFISPEYWPLTGGTGAYVYYLSNELVKNGYKIQIVTGSNQAQDIQVNPQLDVSFLKIPKTPIVKSFLLAAASNRKLNSIRDTVKRRHYPSAVAVNAEFCGAAELWKSPRLHRPLNLEEAKQKPSEANRTAV